MTLSFWLLSTKSPCFATEGSDCYYQQLTTSQKGSRQIHTIFFMLHFFHLNGSGFYVDNEQMTNFNTENVTNIPAFTVYVLKKILYRGIKSLPSLFNASKYLKDIS